MPRTTKNPGVFAADAQTTIPPTPVVGVAYRNAATGLAAIRAGWPFKTIVDSSDFAQILHELTSFTDLIDKTGILEYKDDIDYDIVPAFAVGSDGELYKSTAINGPASTVIDPVGDLTGVWETIQSSFNLGTASSKDVGTANGKVPLYNASGVDGLGYGGASTTPVGSIDALVKTGFYTTAASTTGTFPSGSGKIGVLTVVTRSSTYVSQKFHDTAADRIYNRVVVNGSPLLWTDQNPIKAWVQFNGTGTVSINASSGVSSITDRGVGLYTVNLSPAMPSNNYATFGFASRGIGGSTAVVMGDTSVSRTTTAVPIQVRAVDNTAQDAGEISIQIVGA
tara:strand:- start:1235 stop:2245 length:1011 start_codon:yes stop_codon:yes gene_type:complete